MSDQYLTRQQVLNRIQEAIDKAGSAAALARKLDVSPAYITNVSSGESPGPKLRKLIGVERVSDLWIAVAK